MSFPANIFIPASTIMDCLLAKYDFTAVCYRDAVQENKKEVAAALLKDLQQYDFELWDVWGDEITVTHP